MMVISCESKNNSKILEQRWPFVGMSYSTKKIKSRGKIRVLFLSGYPIPRKKTDSEQKSRNKYRSPGFRDFPLGIFWYFQISITIPGILGFSGLFRGFHIPMPGIWEFRTRDFLGIFKSRSRSPGAIIEKYMNEILEFIKSSTSMIKKPQYPHFKKFLIVGIKIPDFWYKVPKICKDLEIQLILVSEKIS